MQVNRAEITPVTLKMRQPMRMAHLPEIEQVTAIFVRLDLRDGRSAWGCTVAHPEMTGEKPEKVLADALACADMVPSLHPTHIEYSLAEMNAHIPGARAALCAFDLAFYDLLGLAAGMPLYRLLGGYRNKIQTSATIPIGPVADSVEIAQERVRAGFRMLKIKGGISAEEDVHRVRAIGRALPGIVLRLDADGGYTVREALEVAIALQIELEMLEQPTPADDLKMLREVTAASPVLVLADQSVSSPTSALAAATQHAAHAFSVKVGACGGLGCARQVDSIARAAGLATMVSCLVEPALLTAAGLSLALSSPNIRYGDLDGHIDLLNDPTLPGFRLEEGWLVATDFPGLGCGVALN